VKWFLAAMPILSHRRFRSDVHRLIDGELPVERVHALGDHLHVCERCRGDLGWWLSIRRSLCRDRTAPYPPSADR
jgi:anti-sigma factor RsiW